MQPLSAFTLPLDPRAPPSGYTYPEHALSDFSTTTAFNAGLDERDIFLGECRCIICGDQGRVVQYCHIIPETESHMWRDLKHRGWLPEQAKNAPQHEPRNGLLLCANHRVLFDGYEFFIRFFPDAQKFVLIDYSDQPNQALQPYHGKAVALDISDKHVPFPSLFIIHEMRVRGHHPFHNITPDVPANNAIDWQQWVTTSDVWDNTGGHFRRGELCGGPGLSQTLSATPITTSGGGGTGTQPLEFNENTIVNILAATHAMPSWKECVLEGTSWTGTAEENRQKYLSISQVS